MRTITEPAKEVPIVAEVDVLVAGGGPAGVAAATCAARLGAKTMLIERYGCLGGMATSGLVLFMDGLFDANGMRCIGGVHWESLQRLRAIGGLAEDTPTRLHVDSELYKVVVEQLCLESGVALRLHTWAVGAIVEQTLVKGVIVESKSGRQAILCRVCVDATGDGDIAAFAGAGYDVGTLRIGLNFKIGGVDRRAFQAFQRESPERAQALRMEVLKAGGVPLGLGLTPYSDQGVFWVNVLGLADRGDSEPALVDGRWNFAGNLSAIDADDLTYVEVELRRRILKGIEYYRKNVPGFEHVHLLAFASQLGVRDSRHIRGVHRVTAEEADAGVEYKDTIGITARLSPLGTHLHVPYRALLPEKVDGLLASGRCVSCDQRLVGPLRVIAPCMMTGQAAGTAAALAAKSGLTPRDLDVKALQKQLAADGVIFAR